MTGGTQFDRKGTKLVFGRESAQSRNRILHAQGDSTGREILRALHAKAQALKNISFWEFEFSTELEISSGGVTGIGLISEKGLPQQVACSAVLLATGGMGQVYRNTTNPEEATGDGIAMAFRAGAEVSDMEFIQFHPTVLYLKKAPRFLLSEALEGEGGYLRNIEMDRFMAKYHPLAELAPRDLVARAIMHEMEVSHAKDPYVYLDLTHLKASQVQKHFPRIYAACLQYNIDITEDLIPIRPAAHYAMGGVRTDLNGKTNVAGLYAAGEAAATGVHGANRWASNSLLEGLVYGARAGKAMREELKESRGISEGSESGDAERAGGCGNGRSDRADSGHYVERRGHCPHVEWGCRRRSGSCRHWLREWRIRGRRRAWEAANLHLAGSLVVRAALAREESRGAHYRTDYPTHDDKKFLKHSVIKGETLKFV